MDRENIRSGSFDHPPSLAELLDSYHQSQQNDPRSALYKRQLVRPRIPFGKLLLCSLLTVAVCATGGVLVAALTHSVLWAVVAAMGVLLMTLLIFAKSIAIWSVKIYQALAPQKVRMRCRYEPSCSMYMILCLEKYGFLKGMKKGLKRWGGCKPPNGGYDWPE